MKKLIGLCLCMAIFLMLAVTTAQASLVVPDGAFAVDGREIAFHKQGAPVILSEPGDYDWWHGCSPTATGMMIGHYDVGGYNSQSYDNLVPGGPAENSTYGSGPYLANSGIGEYIEYAGYDADVLCNQYIDTQGKMYGFTFAQYIAEIDTVRPVLIQVEDHSMYGYGYDSATSSVVLHDTWTEGQHNMMWGCELIITLPAIGGWTTTA